MSVQASKRRKKIVHSQVEAPTCPTNPFRIRGKIRMGTERSQTSPTRRYLLALLFPGFYSRERERRTPPQSTYRLCSSQTTHTLNEILGKVCSRVNGIFSLSIMEYKHWRKKKRWGFSSNEAFALANFVRVQLQSAVILSVVRSELEPQRAE